jgi:uncharacterized membrane protein YdbT with pleckstrin-like domain
MSYIDQNLTAGESVIYETRLHWIVMVRSIVLACFLVAVAAFLFYNVQNQASIDANTLHLIEAAGTISLIAAFVAVVIGATRRNATEMAVTNRRVVIKVGLVGRRTVEMILNKIESIEVKETALGRMLGYGTIVVIGTGGTPEPFLRVAHPLQFRTAVQQQIEKLP